MCFEYIHKLVTTNIKMDVDVSLEKLTIGSQKSESSSAKLDKLPPEILGDICCYLASAQSFRNLALCNHTLNEFIKAQGWKTFIRTQFPASSTSVLASGVNAEDAAKSMTSLSRSWDRRAVLATRLHPNSSDPHFGREDHHEAPRRPWAHWRPRFRFRQRGQQTIGFQPVIASQEEVLNSEWTRRREFVVWGAGAQLGFRMKHTGVKAEERTKEQELDQLDQHGNDIKWNTFQPEASRDGADDITSLKLLSREYVSRHSKSSSDKVDVITGTAAGRLALSKMEIRPGQEALLKKEFVYRTGRISSVRSIDISPCEDLLVSGYSNGLIMLHFVYNRDRRGFPISNVSLDHNHGHLWATSFLSNTRIAVGSGRCYQPLHIYEITHSGLSENPVRSYTFADDQSSSEVFGSVGCIEKLPDAPGLSSEVVFLTGHTDGAVRLHDLRSTKSHESTFSDPVDDGAVFSLVTKGRQGIIAGSSRNSLIKMFDIRMTGGRAYSYGNVAGTQGPEDIEYRARGSSNGWSLFLHPGESTSSSNTRGGNRRNSLTSSIGDARASASPVYSLSSPSAYSPSIFAGMEAQVTQIDIVDVFDKHPDPIFHTERTNTVGSKWFWDPSNSSKNLAYYEHSQANKLRKQGFDWPENFSQMSDKGYDYRWVEMAQN